MARHKYQQRIHENPEIKDFDFEAFSRDLHSKRWAKGYTLSGLGAVVGCSAATLSRMERGRHMPSLADFLFICYWFSMSPMDYFIEPDDDKQLPMNFIAAGFRQGGEE